MVIDYDAYRNWRSRNIASDTSNHNVSFRASASSPSNEKQKNSLPIHSSTGSDVLSTSSQPSAVEAPYPITFNQVVDLIVNGRPVPGIKKVPDTLLPDQESQAKTAKRKKPWEKPEIESMTNIL